MAVNSSKWPMQKQKKIQNNLFCSYIIRYAIVSPHDVINIHVRGYQGINKFLSFSKNTKVQSQKEVATCKTLNILSNTLKIVNNKVHINIDQLLINC